MTREMAVIGVPTISIYQDELLKVDKYLIEVGAMVHVKNLTADFVDRFLTESTSSGFKSELLLKGRETYKIMKSQLLNFD